MADKAAEPICIRHANPDDASVIAEFTRLIALETEGISLDPEVVVNGVKNALRESRHGFYVIAENSQQIIGCLMVTYEWSDWRNGLQWWLQSVYVDSRYRGIGVLKKLFRFVMELAVDQANVCGVRLYVDRSNANAIAAYRSLGMTLTDYHVFEMSLTDELTARMKARAD